VTVVMRPEHAVLVKASQGHLKGVIETIVYFGTDTHFHVRLDGEHEFMVRQQNSGSATNGLLKGARVGVQIAAGTARILRD
jgi:spermidine/putrescine transport system ATP-binding protein